MENTPSYLAVAMSQSGIKQGLTAVLAALPSDAFKVTVDDMTKGPFNIPLGPLHYCLHLTGGKTTSVGLTMHDLVASSATGIKYRLSVLLSLGVLFDHWDENYQEIEQVCILSKCHDIVHDRSASCGAFAIQLKNAELIFDVMLVNSASGFKLQLAPATPQPPITSDRVSFQIPAGSALGDMGCLQGRVNDALADAIAAHDYSKDVAKAVNDLIASIPDSGRIGDNIDFEFSPVHLDTSSGSGVEVSITGRVKSKGTYWPAGTNVQVTSPTNPPPDGKDLAVHLHQEEFGGLLWAFYENGYLQADFTIAAEDIPDSEKLSTNSYQYGPLKILSQDFADMAIIVHVKAKAAPTAKIEKQTAQTLSATAHPGVTAVSVLEVGMDLTGEDANETPVRFATFTLTQTDRLANLAITPTSPRLTFDFHLDSSRVDLIYACEALQAYLKTTYPQSSVEEAFGLLWQNTLSGVYALYLAAIGKAGIPIPHFPSLQLHLTETTITADNAFLRILGKVSA